ncbi:MAG: hypothetical protein BGO55_03585 [Sphingobacteriales bacterium 50-39]|nr:hypothetical protein [Sphingobacteriales bacterium]OJW55631.1 MAG: hypothetical protein BGO55_03585 [Sphingobacteriales bacterium 50-39]
MFDCECLIHPFQNDPGTSQSQRIMDELLDNAPKIDARTLADLLNFFVQLSRQINYYDLQMNLDDWQPFFRKSAPFNIAAIISYDTDAIRTNYEGYNALFQRRPSTTGLQLNAYFLYYRFINIINTWHLSIKDSDLPLTDTMENVIRNTLQQPVRLFISYANAAAQTFGMKPIDITPLQNNPVWGMTPNTLIAADTEFSKGTTSRYRQIINLAHEFSSLLPAFMGATRALATEAQKNLQQSLLPLKAELQKLHPPHLGLLFAFLGVFQQLQNDLNRYTRKHLDFFYSSILQFKPAGAVPDKAHIIFEIQKALKTYLIKKGIKVKDGKDDNKQEILFGLDNEMVANQAQVKDTRTLFLNNFDIPDAAHPGDEIAVMEGVYMAPVATMADGIDKDFQTDVKNFYTVGNKESKYIIPGTRTYKPYPNARLGFILASPVLLLNEGRRTVNVTIACQLEDPTVKTELLCDSGTDPNEYPTLFSTQAIFKRVRKAFRQSYVYISEDLIQQAIKKGISDATADLLLSFLLEQKKMVCNNPESTYRLEDAVRWSDWWTRYYHNFSNPLYPELAEKAVIDALFPARHVLKVLFSGEKEWITPTRIKRLRFTPLVVGAAGKKTFAIKFKAILDPTKGAVTFFDKDKLKEDYNTTLPVVKIELDDKIKVKRGFPVPKKSACCLQIAPDPHKRLFSFYYFLRNVKVIDKTDTDMFTTTSFPTGITVKVCGLKKFVVQNDESVMDVNGPVYPFGARPDIQDFNVISPSFCITPAFIADASSNPNAISAAGANALSALLSPANGNKIRVSMAARDNFLKQTFQNPVPTVLSAAEQDKLNSLIDDPTKNYCGSVLRGPNFYVGSKEVFCKKWNDVYINFNWKDKPADFRDHYKAYIAKHDTADPTKYIYGLDKKDFQINLAVLDDGKWHAEDPTAAPPADVTVTNITTNDQNRLLFPDQPQTASPCMPLNPFDQSIHISNQQFTSLTRKFEVDTLPFVRLESGSRKGFLRINLQNQDFLHKDYAYVLARQMNAAAALTVLDPSGVPIKLVDDAVYYDANGNLIFFSATKIRDNVAKSLSIATTVEGDINGATGIKVNTGVSAADYGNPIPFGKADKIRDILNPPPPLIRRALMKNATSLKDTIKDIDTVINNTKNFQAIIPNEPWTPIIQGISIDYTATASLTDLNLIHLYPYDGTYKAEEIALQPTLLPTFCDEGTLFIGLENLVPGSNLNILFQLAEATADSEQPKEPVHWHYLTNNEWQPLRTGFEVLDDATKNLTSSGIVKYALPETMTNDNTVMPKKLHWIKATIPQHSKAVSETTAIMAQAMLAVFTNDAVNDKLRLAKPLLAGSISKLFEADASVKTVSQPFDSFDGALPEAEKMFYVRVSETLRHKGRAIQAFDYERLALQAFPKLFKAKCINHSLQLNANEYTNDYPYAPGFVILALIPDLTKLKAGNSFEPKVPVSMLEDIDAYIRKRISPFVRFRSVNPRYEKIHFSIKVMLVKGKDAGYYTEKLKQDVRELLAPWAIGKYDKLTFGQCVYRSDIIRLLETSGYVDFITELRMGRTPTALTEDARICPGTPRSILVAGDIDVCIETPGCPDWGPFSPCDDQNYLKPCDHEPVPIARKCIEDKKPTNNLYGG